MDGLTDTNITAPDPPNAIILNLKSALSQPRHYLMALLTVLATLVVELLIPALFETYFFLPFWGIIAFNAWYGGITTGVLASILSMVSADIFLQPPLYHFHPDASDWAALFIGFALSILVNAPHARRRQLESDLHRAYANVERERQRVTNILASISESYFALDPDFHFTDLNPHAEEFLARLSGKTRAELIGQVIWDVLPDWSAGEFGQSIRAALTSQGTQRFEWQVSPLNVWYEVHAYPHQAGLNIFLEDITDRKQAETLLRDNEARMRMVLEGMPVLLSVNDENGRRIFWNQEAERVTGYSAAEVVGNPRLGDLLYPDPAYQAEIDRFRSQRDRDWRDWELETRCKDGSIRIISWSNISKHYPIPGWHDWALGVDITERKRAQAERDQLYQAAQVARTQAERIAERMGVLQAITGALSWAVTPQAVANVMVGQVMEILGGHIGSVMGMTNDGQHAELLNQKGVPDDLRALYQHVPLTEPIPMTEVIRTGEIIWLENVDEYRDRYPHISATIQPRTQSQAMICFPLRLNDRIIGSMGFTFLVPFSRTQEDLTFIQAVADQGAQALERARLFEAEHAARLEAERANALKLQFLGMISHELRTPLSSIKGFATTLLADDVDFDQSSKHEFLTVIDQESDRLSELVEQLLDLSRLQASSMSIHQEEIAFDSIIEAARPNLNTLTAFHHLELDLPPDLPPVLADTRRIVQVIVNLVSNAARYAPPFTTITLGVRRHDDMLQVDVTDKGPGIPHDQRQQVFEAFRQGDGTLEKRSQGAGLGLAICKGLVEAHGGKIWIGDQPPSGTTVSFTLPFAPLE